MNNTFQVRLAWNGTITLPKKLREENNIKRDETVMLIVLGNAAIVLRLESSPID